MSLLAGVTRVLTPVDIAQFTLTHTQGHGYYSDPYKLADQRPDTRRQDTALLQWNHRFVAQGASSRLIYRYYRDSYGISAHTLGAEWVQGLGDGWTVTPAARLYTQRAADFYSIRCMTASWARPSRPVTCSPVRKPVPPTSACQVSARSRWA
ncbi:DUF3570 domain-containing protein [Massilia eburnea]|uniref:DUF3570 domain-containing protein n=1 Tax=Massilia eburnea TaxID=1776165 RepID=UPI003D6C5F58